MLGLRLIKINDNYNNNDSNDESILCLFDRAKQQANKVATELSLGQINGLFDALSSFS